MSLPIIAAIRDRRDLKESVLHTAQELAHKASIYGVVRVSNRYMGEKCHCHQRTFQRHVLRLIDAHILKKTVVKKLVKVRVGNTMQDRLRNEVNTYTFTLRWHKAPSPNVPIDKKASNLPPPEREKNLGVREELERQRKAIHLGLVTPGSVAWEGVQDKIARLEALLVGTGDRT